ncbi:MAG: FAD:protein FMN transferase, partial [bacterium]|nr:FAD:protein FMN transferase [bacterium]
MIRNHGDSPFIRDDYMMDTAVRITLPVRNRDDAAEAVSRMHHIASLVDDFSPASDISRVNASVRPVRVSDTTRLMLKESLIACKKTDGAFDITCGGLSKLWGFKDGNYRVPEDKEIKRLLTGVDYRCINVSDMSVVAGRRENTYLDLGGIAKGFVVDRAVGILVGRGVPYGIVDAGGNLRCWGRKPRGKPWIVGVQHPRRPDGIIGRLILDKPAAIATSGDYQRFFIRQEKRYCHIIDPSSGRPVEDIMSATVIGDSAMDADAVATAVCVMGRDKGLELLKR